MYIVFFNVLPYTSTVGVRLPCDRKCNRSFFPLLHFYLFIIYTLSLSLGILSYSVLYSVYIIIFRHSCPGGLLTVSLSMLTAGYLLFWAFKNIPARRYANYHQGLFIIRCLIVNTLSWAGLTRSSIVDQWFACHILQSKLNDSAPETYK